MKALCGCRLRRGATLLDGSGEATGAGAREACFIAWCVPFYAYE
jgi:hypothetical protein